MAGPAIIPRPSSLELGSGWFVLTSRTTIGCDPGARDCADLLAEYLRGTGLPLSVSVRGPQAQPSPDDGITLRLVPADPELGPEGYRLDADESGVRIRAGSAAGLLNGVQTLRQLLPSRIYSAPGAPVGREATPAPALGVGADWRIPAVRIRDSPRFGWRGSMLDVARWYLPPAYLYRYVETLAVHKLNRLHLHLTDDQGWRFEVHRHPRLTQIGAWRAESPAGHASQQRYDGLPHGGSYTQTELRDLVAFAARRGVEVVPEIDLPGHTTAAIAAYPAMGNAAGAVGAGPAVSRDWGVHRTVLNLEEPTLRFCREVLDEVMDVFPSPWIHLGGDECPIDEWQASARVADRIRALGLSGVGRVQEWFTRQLAAHLLDNGRTPIVWDEAATPGLPPEAVVMAWRSQQYGAAAAAAGHQVIMAPEQYTYFDHYPSDEPGQPVAIGGLTRLPDVFGWDPVPADAGPLVRGRILGTQGQLWTEYLPTPERVDQMAYPRLTALAERAWSSPAGSYPDFVARLAVHAERLAASGVSAAAAAGSPPAGPDRLR
jgi:hexosaminidase